MQFSTQQRTATEILAAFKEEQHQSSHYISMGNALGTPRGLPGPSGLEPQKSPKRVRKGVPPWGAPESPKSAPRSLKRVQKESEAAFLDSFWTPWRTFWGLWGSPGRATLSDSFRTLLGFQARRARETSVPGRGVPKAMTLSPNEFRKGPSL